MEYDAERYFVRGNIKIKLYIYLYLEKQGAGQTADRSFKVVSTLYVV